MTVLELALIDIRNFKEVKKLVLKPGINLIQGENGSGKTTLCEIFFHLLFPSYEAYPEARSSQAALLFKTRNGEIYRLVRHFSKRIPQLYKLDAAKKLILVEKEEEGVQNKLNPILKTDLIPLEALSSYFLLNRFKLPSNVKLQNSGLALPAAPSPPAEIQPSDEKIRQRIAELRKEAVRSDQLAQKESQLLDFKDKVYSLKRNLNELESVESELSAVLEKEKTFTGFETIPMDIGGILEEYEKNFQEKNSEEQQLTDEKEIIEQQLVMDQQNLLQNKFLWGGAGLVALTLLLPVFLELESLFKNINLAVLLTGFGLALFALVSDFSRISRKKIWKSKLENKIKNLEILTAKFKRENAKYFSILEKTRCPDKESFENQLSAYHRLKEEEENILSRKQHILHGKTREALEKEILEFQEKTDQSEKEVNQLKPGCLDPYVIQNELKSLEEKLSGGPSLADPIPDNLLGGELPETVSLPPSHLISSFFEKDWPLLLKTSGLNPEQAAVWIQKKMTPFTGNPPLLQINKEGKIRDAPSLETLSPGTLDRLFIGLFFIRAELLQGLPVPLLLDDPFQTQGPSSQSLLLNLLKETTRTRQVILFSNFPCSIENANILKL